ncbi:MAG TPA: FtsX-like permease family protein [Terracidiphilus sp.]|jgi:putative ABC transport system permease protein
MNKLVFANLLHRPLRSIISVLAVAIEVIMILSIVGIFMGMLNDQKQRTNGTGADLMMRPSNTSAFNGVSGAPMSARLAEPLRNLPHVAVVAPVITHLNTGASIEILYGIDYDTFDALKPFVFVSGNKFAGPNDVIVDDVFAGPNSKNPATGRPYVVGDSIDLLNTSFRICGIVEHGKGGRKLIPIDTMGALLGGAQGKASIFYIKVDDPKNDQAVIEEIRSVRGLADYPVQTMQEWLSEMTPEKLPGFNLALNIVTGIAVVVGFLVIFQSMYTAVLERTREIGILKSMGASKSTIVTVVLREATVVAILGIVVGTVGVYAVRALLLHAFPTQHFEITTLWVAQGAAIAFIGSLCGALYPAWMAARKDPIDALAYE